MNNANAFYSSLWDIDQIYLQNEVDNISLAGSTSSLATVPLVTYSLSYPPVVDGQFKISGDTVWRQLNDPNFSSFWVNVNMFFATTPAGLNLRYTNLNAGAGTVNVRYWVWTDKVNY